MIWAKARTSPIARAIARRLALSDARLAQPDDRGASLVIALIFITVVAIVMGTVLSFIDVSMRNTIVVRAEAARAAAADGAAQVAINSIRRGTFKFNSGQCFGGSTTLSLGNFYQPASGTGYSAAVACEVDTSDSVVGTGVAVNSHNRPDNAILTLGTSLSEDGISLNANGSKNSIKVHGGIFSNSNISVDKLTTNASVTARGHCTGTIVSAATNCDIGSSSNPSGNDPDYPVPTGSTTLQPVPACRGTKKVVTFTPGRYTDLTNMNKLTDGCDGTFYFPPGTYYFDFNGEWRLGSGYLVGGTPTPGQVADGVVPDMPGSCETPVPPDPLPPGGWINPGPNAGVQFVFGGDTQLALSKGQMEICGSYSASTPPIAIYGLKSSFGPGGVVPGENGCILTIGKSGCSVISSDHSPNSAMYIQGTTYVPNAAVDIELNNSTGQVFRYGIIARHLSVSATGSANLSDAVIEVPDTTLGGGLRTVVYLRIYVCTGTTVCSTSGNAQLRVKVGIEDPSGVPVAGARQITVYSWSVQQ